MVLLSGDIILFGENGLIKLLVKRALENVLEHEMTSHLGYDKHSIRGSNTGNSRNGHSSKTIRTDSGNVNLTIPRHLEIGMEILPLK